MEQSIFKKAKMPGKKYIDVFLGLNRKDVIAENEFSDLLNIDGAHYPMLAPRRARTKSVTQSGIKAVIADNNMDGDALTSFTGVAGTQFYYKGITKGAVSGNASTCLVDFNGTVLIFPDKKYYNYVTDEFGDIEVGYTNISVTFGSSGSEDTNNLTNTISKTGGWGDVFKSGDSLALEFAGKPKNSTFTVNSKYTQADDNQIVSCVVAKVDGNLLYVNCYNRLGVKLAFQTGGASGTVKKAMPDITRACVANNRVFGIDNGGELVYASKLGDFTNWNVFEGLSTDSWYAQVGTEGKFTGIAALNSGIILFKRNYLHEVFGSTPQNFTIPKQIGVGCIDARSVCEAAGSLFFLSRDGFYLYNGGTPRRISEKLNETYVAAVSGCDGKRVYVCADTSSGANTASRQEQLVYDLERQTWYRQDVQSGTVAFLPYNGRFYIAADGGMFDVSGSGYSDNWYAVSKPFTESTFDHKSAINLYARFQLSVGAWVQVYRRVNGGMFELCGEIRRESSVDTRTVMRIPIRIHKGDSYQIKFTGSGDVRIEALETVISVGGRTER